ncbi:MAG: outer membrane beta-barrel protein [Ferruginibacter sp.]
MKKIISVSIVLMLTASLDVMAQPTGTAYEKNSSNISLGYGFVNVWGRFLERSITLPEYQVKSQFFFTLVYEYALLNRVSAGLSASYSRVRGEASRYQLLDQITIFSVLARANYHVFKSSKFDPYFGGGIGINNSQYRNLNRSVIPVDKVPSLLDFSAQLGLKYFPVKHLGFYMEAGYVGGAILHLGVTGSF